MTATVIDLSPALTAAIITLAAILLAALCLRELRTARREHLTQPGHRHIHKTDPGDRLARCSCGDTVSLWRAL